MKPSQVVKNCMTAMESGDLKKAATFLSEDFVFEGPVPKPVGKKEFLDLMKALTAAIPDWSFNMGGATEAGDKVELDIRIMGTHLRELNLSFMGIPVAPATQKIIRLPQEHLTVTVKSGKVSSIRVQPVPGGSLEGILKQIGLEMATVEESHMY